MNLYEFSKDMILNYEKRNILIDSYRNDASRVFGVSIDSVMNTLCQIVNSPSSDNEVV